MAPQLSIIIPIYNSEKYLKQCIDSIINQTYKDFEILLVDDASTDNSANICNEYAEKYEFIKFIRKEHRGPTHTRKAGLKEASGEFISFIDSDDYIQSDMYSYLMEKIVSHSADIAICNIVIESEESRLYLHTEFEEGFYDKERLIAEIYPIMLASSNKDVPGIQPSLCNKIIRKSILENVMAGITDEIRFGEDGICSYPCMLDANGVYITCDKFLYVYRKNLQSISNRYDATILQKLPLLISVFETEFGKRGFEGESQIDRFAALHLIFGIRSELLYNKKKSLRQKVRYIKEYLSQPRIKEVLRNIKYASSDIRVKQKIYLLRVNWIYLLYVLFCFTEMVILLKGKIKCKSATKAKQAT